MKRQILSCITWLLFAGTAWAGSIDINSASASELTDLDRIGRAYAERIVEERETHGPYLDVDDLTRRVRGLGPAFVEANDGRLSFDDDH